MAFHATRGCANRPLPGEDSDFESKGWCIVLRKGEAVPCKFSQLKITGPSFSFGGSKGGAYGGGGWGMEEEKNRYSEEDNEEKSGAEVKV